MIVCTQRGRFSSCFPMFPCLAFVFNLFPLRVGRGSPGVVIRSLVTGRSRIGLYRLVSMMGSHTALGGLSAVNHNILLESCPSCRPSSSSFSSSPLFEGRVMTAGARAPSVCSDSPSVSSFLFLSPSSCSCRLSPPGGYCVFRLSLSPLSGSLAPVACHSPPLRLSVVCRSVRVILHLRS